MVLVVLILVVFYATALASTGNDTQIPVASSLRFFLLGDWGKGGATGTYGSVLQEDETAIEHLGSPDSVSIKEADIVEAQLVFGSSSSRQHPHTAAKTLYQVAIASAMGAFVQTSEVTPSFVISLGDNFYDNGVPSADSVLWQYLWKDIYLIYQGLNIPWYPVFGNHDYTGGSNAVQAQLQRTQAHVDDDIWMMESTNFTKRFEFQPSADNATIVSVGIVFIDTTTLAPSACNKCNQ